MSTSIAHFVISGEFITRQARAFWNDEDAQDKAFRLLKCVHGITGAQCLDILEGRKQLIGDSDSGIELADDNAVCRSLEQTLIDFRRERDEARDDRADLIQMVNGDTVGVASPTGRREIPRRKSTKNRSMLGRVTSVVAGYEFDDLAKDDDKPLRIWRQSGYGDPAGMDLRDVELGEEDEPAEPTRPAPPAAQPTITSDTGWLSPDGKFYPCNYAQHAHVAWALGLTDNAFNHSIQPDGWVRLGVTDDRQYFFGEHALFNETQNALIRAYCTERKIELPFWLEMEVP